MRRYAEPVSSGRRAGRTLLELPQEARHAPPVELVQRAWTEKGGQAALSVRTARDAVDFATWILGSLIKSTAME